MYRPKHKAKRFYYRPIYANYDHPFLCLLGAMATTLAMVTVFMLIAFA